MSSSTSCVWVISYDPRQSPGLAAMPGERARHATTGVVYVKQGTGNTDWILGTQAYGAGGESSGNVDGGSPTSIYGGSIAIDGGGP